MANRIRYRIGKVVGDSAYDIAVKNGFKGTEEEWLETVTSVDEDKLKESLNKYFGDSEE